MRRLFPTLFSLLLIALPSAAFADGYMTFAQFAAGDGLFSSLTLINPGADQANTVVYIFNQDGTSASDLGDGVSFIIPAYGSYVLTIRATGAARVGQLQVLWHMSGPNPLPPNLFGSLLISINGIGSSAIQVAALGSTMVLPAQNTGILRTGLAIANACPYAATASILLRDVNGVPLGSATIQLPANGHVAKFVDEFISNAGTYSGSVTVSAGAGCAAPSTAVAAYDIGSSPGQFIVLPVGVVN